MNSQDRETALRIQHLMNKGRRTGPTTTKDAILDAARARFAEQGYAKTTIRQVAADAGVDAALVHYFFGTKDGLYGAALALPVSPADVIGPALAGGVEGAGERLIRRFLSVWDDPATRPGLLAMVRSAAAHEDSARALREFIAGELRPRVAAVTGTADGDLRAVLVGSALIGVAFERYILAVEPIASADPEAIVAFVGPTIQRYLEAERP
jgi:AcrR family transcriptional regulator